MSYVLRLYPIIIHKYIINVILDSNKRGPNFDIAFYFQLQYSNSIFFNPDITL